MTSANKRRGDRWELAVQDHAQANGFPWCEKTRAGYERDEGDLHLVPGPSVIVQAKNHAAMRLPEWLRQLDEQLANSDAAHGFLAVKVRGVGDPGQCLAVMRIDAALALLREAGYGTEVTP